MTASILQPGRLILSRFPSLSGCLDPYLFLFFPDFDRTARDYITLGRPGFAADNLFAPFHAESEVIAVEHVEGGWTNSDFAMLMATLMDLDTKRVVLVGDSYGGMVALRFFLWLYFHQLQPFEDIATILIGTPDGIDCVREPFHSGAIDLARSPDDLREYALAHAHRPLEFIDEAARAALIAQDRSDLIPVIAGSYRSAAPLIPTNLTEMITFPGFARLLAQHLDAFLASRAPYFGPISFGGRVLTINATHDSVIDVDRSVASVQRVFGRTDPITVASGPHSWLDIHSHEYAVALIQAMRQLCLRGFGPDLAW